MTQQLFHLKHGIIPACDVDTLQEFEALVKSTSPIEGVVGYKVGCILVLTYGLPSLAEVLTKHTALPLIYDHQKAGTDIPDLAPRFAKACARAGTAGIIIYPQSGPETEVAFIRNALQEGLVPIVGGEMTHPRYLANEGGFIRTSAAEEIYKIGVDEGISLFVVPGNKPEMIRKYVKLLSEAVKSPGFLMPGIGRQGGDITESFEAVGGHACYAIVGSSIYRAADIEKATAQLCEEALQFEGEAL